MQALDMHIIQMHIHTHTHNVILWLKMFPTHKCTQGGRKVLSVQQSSFLRGGNIVLWVSYSLLYV